ncbi:hypothetical protein MWU83_21075 [Mycolicibacterium sp. F2034L]|nr:MULTISPECIES: hypothetical protein [Mycobacteriaceae]MCK0176664.1 hypothetical protein [Mycolicibacterium sp. F2034L]
MDTSRLVLTDDDGALRIPVHDDGVVIRGDPFGGITASFPFDTRVQLCETARHRGAVGQIAEPAVGERPEVAVVFDLIAGGRIVVVINGQAGAAEGVREHDIRECDERVVVIGVVADLGAAQVKRLRRQVHGRRHHRQRHRFHRRYDHDDRPQGDRHGDPHRLPHPAHQRLLRYRWSSPSRLRGGEW